MSLRRPRDASRAPTHQWPYAEPSEAIGAGLVGHSFAATRLAFALVARCAEASAPARTRCRTRLHRARRLLRDALEKQAGPVLTNAFPFDGRRCERMTNKVLERLALRI